MEIHTFDASICVMTKIFHLIGGKWKPIILYLIKHDINRFGNMKRHMPKISKKILTEQLRELESDGLISREVITADSPQVVVYHLTPKGVSVRKLIDNMLEWGLNYFKQDYPEKAISEYTHRRASQAKE